MLILIHLILLVSILNPLTLNDVKAVVSFIKESLELRKGDQ